jgi:hypothetical protein
LCDKTLMEVTFWNLYLLKNYHISDVI